MNDPALELVTRRLANLRRVVVKIGTSLVDHPVTRFNYPLIFDLVAQLKQLRDRGVDVVLVTSGAVGSGMRELGIREYPSSIVRKQALAAIGQPFLMHQYGDIFAKFGLRKAQVLLTREGMEDRRRYLHARDCLEDLLRLGVVPIVNENDTVAVAELRFGDNDQLSAIVAAELHADVLLLLTDVDGLYTADPRQSPDAELIRVVGAITPELLALAGGKGSTASTGGMQTKVLAARHATAAGVLTGIVNGSRPGAVLEMLQGRAAGTWFVPGGNGMRGRRRWIAARAPAGAVVIDDGAVKALTAGGKSLLPVGITAVEGVFAAGALIRVCDPAGREVALGISSYSSDEIAKAKGHSTDELEAIFGPGKLETAVIHRDNMVLRGG